MPEPNGHGNRKKKKKSLQRSKSFVEKSFTAVCYAYGSNFFPNGHIKKTYNPYRALLFLPVDTKPDPCYRNETKSADRGSDEPNKLKS